MSYYKHTLLRGSSGINTKIDPVRLSATGQGNVIELAAAVNIDIDERMRINRRRGYTQLLSSSAHSLFSAGNYCIFVSGDALSTLDKSYNVTSIRNVTPGLRMDYAQVGDCVYYVNGRENGYVKDMYSFVWVKGDYVGPDTNKDYTSPPTDATLICAYNGIMYLACDNILYYSEPFAYGAYDLASNYVILDSSITMLKSVKDGLYVGTENKVEFLYGSNPIDFKYIPVSNHGVIKHTAVRVSGTNLNEVVDCPIVILWTTSKGIYLGLEGGRIANLTETKVTYPSASRGAGMYIDGRYRVTLES